LLSLVLLTVVSLGVEPQARTPAEMIRARVEDLHDAKPPVVRGVRLRRSDAVVHFFELRTFEPAWNTSAIDQIRQAIHDVETDGLAPADYHLAAIDALLQQKPAAADVAGADLQVLVTDAVAALIDDVRFGKVRPVTLDRRWNVDPRAGAPPLETLIAQVASASSQTAAIDAIKPSHFIYAGLKRALADTRRTAAAGGWPSVPPGPALKPGAKDPRADAIRKRLVASGDHKPDPPADAAAYDADLEASVKKFQERNRLAADGVIGPATVQAMNVTAAARVDQVRANLERARWVVNGLSDSFVLVNLPAFKAYVIRDRKNVWETRTQIGREARQTPAFRADLRYLVFNPDWTVPPTILSQDVLAGMRKGENTIAKKKLTILDRQGRTVDPSTIDWANATRANFPYTLRQPPGDDNALGRVKFIFPNEHSIFLHDTPSQQLFGQEQRTFSSGCIRVERALDLAAVLLDGQEDWNRAKIDTTVDGGASKTVFLETPLQVLIVYWTVSVGASGEVRFARDVYNRDAPLLAALAR
jgi:murein L,D-transpeptidase YcbB/YkuD